MSLSGTDLNFIVVDADAISFVLKQDRVRGPRYARHFAGRDVVLPFSVVAELRLWAAVRKWGPQRRAYLESFLQILTEPDV